MLGSSQRYRGQSQKNTELICKSTCTTCTPVPIRRYTWYTSTCTFYYTIASLKPANTSEAARDWSAFASFRPRAIIVLNVVSSISSLARGLGTERDPAISMILSDCSLLLGVTQVIMLTFFASIIHTPPFGIYYIAMYCKYRYYSQKNNLCYSRGPSVHLVHEYTYFQLYVLFFEYRRFNRQYSRYRWVN